MTCVFVVLSSHVASCCSEKELQRETKLKKNKVSSCSMNAKLIWLKAIWNMTIQHFSAWLTGTECWKDWDEDFPSTNVLLLLMSVDVHRDIQTCWSESDVLFIWVDNLSEVPKQKPGFHDEKWVSGWRLPCTDVFWKVGPDKFFGNLKRFVFFSNADPCTSSSLCVFLTSTVY